MRVFAATTALFDGVAVEGWEKSLPSDKRLEIGRMRREQDRALTLTAYRLLCFGLKVAYDIVPKETDWRRTPQGKPYLAGHAPCFNLSHSGDVVICALHETCVGADVEKVRPIEDSLAQRVMSGQEYTMFLAAQDQADFFFRVWTMKEAYIKYVGEGLRKDMKSFEAYPLEGRIQTSVTDCEFTLLDGFPGYRAAICADELAAEPVVWVSKMQLDRV
ncbi:MAG: 4'-phosphopantetheinyl transferase family protein [Christensenellales bacterium]